MNKMVTPASTAVARRRAAARRRVRRASDSRSAVRMGAAGVAAVGSIEQSPVSPRYGQKRQSDSANHIDQADDLGRGGAPAGRVIAAATAKDRIEADIQLAGVKPRSWPNEVQAAAHQDT